MRVRVFVTLSMSETAREQQHETSVSPPEWSTILIKHLLEIILSGIVKERTPTCALSTEANSSTPLYIGCGDAIVVHCQLFSQGYVSTLSGKGKKAEENEMRGMEID